MKKLIVMRGVPGSGKSTLAEKLVAERDQSDYPRGKVLSTDDFFMHEGEYKFDPKLLGKAHPWNQNRARAACSQGMPLVVIDNTNTQAWEAKPYIQIAQNNGYVVEFQEVKTSWAKDATVCAEKNTHGVPLAAIQGMLNRWEENLTADSCLAAKAPWEK